MIITCPSCATRYAVDATTVGLDGRKVRCARCGHTWLAEASAGEIEDTPPPPPPPRPQNAPLPPGMNLPAMRVPPRPRRPARAGWAALALLVAALPAALYAGRDAIVEAWPPALRLYRTLGIDAGLAGAAAVPGFAEGLTLRDVTPAVRPGLGGDVLWISGEVANLSDVPRPVPALQVALTDPDGKLLHRWSFTLDVPSLAPGESARFETSLRNPDAATAKLAITVADGTS